jgi:hypothetical protein
MSIFEQMDYMSDSFDVPSQLPDRMLRLEKKLDLIYAALLGNDITEDGGMVARLKRVEERATKTEEELNRYKWALVGITTVVPLMITIAIFILKQVNIFK